MEKFRVKRPPVVCDGKVVGVISRANLVHALAGLAREASPGLQSDETIRYRVPGPSSSHRCDVRNAAVDLWGTILVAGQRDAARVAAENVAGVKSVRSHLSWIEPMSGVAISDPGREIEQPNSFPATAARTLSEKLRHKEIEADAQLTANAHSLELGFNRPAIIAIRTSSERLPAFIFVITWAR
jgi:hypothetical protein